MSVTEYIESASEAQLHILKKQSKTQRHVGGLIQFFIDLLPLAFRIGVFALALFSLSTSYDFGIMTGGGETATKWGCIFFVCAALNIILFKLHGQTNRTAAEKKAIRNMIAPLLALDLLAVFGCTIGVNPPEIFTIGLQSIESRQIDIDYAAKKLVEAKKHSRYKSKPEGVLSVETAEAKKEQAVNLMVIERARLKSEGIEVIKPNEVMYHIMAYATPLSPLMLQFINKILFALCVIYVCIMGSKYSDQLKLIMDEVRIAARLKLRAINGERRTKSREDQTAAFASLENKEVEPRYNHAGPLNMVSDRDENSAISSGGVLPENFDAMYDAAKKAIESGGVSPSVRKIALLFYKAEGMEESKMIKSHAELIHKALTSNEIIVKDGDAPNSPFKLAA
jgi:hypothetical protein